MRTRRPASLVRSIAFANALVGSGTASADLVGACAVNIGDIGAGVDSYAVYLLFDDPLDQLLAVGGDANVSPLIFSSPKPLVQHNAIENDYRWDDRPTIADLGGDTWVVIGHPQLRETEFTDGFLGRGDSNISMVKGRYFEQRDNGGYYDREPSTPVLPDDNMQIQIAQFSLDLGAGDQASYQGTAFFNIAGGDLTARAFAVAIVPCIGDIDANGTVDFDDLLRVLDAWGNEGGPEDLDGSGYVDFNDLVLVLAAWGQCE